MGDSTNGKDCKHENEAGVSIRDTVDEDGFYGEEFFYTCSDCREEIEVVILTKLRHKLTEDVIEAGKEQGHEGGCLCLSLVGGVKGVVEKECDCNFGVLEKALKALGDK